MTVHEILQADHGSNYTLLLQNLGGDPYRIEREYQALADDHAYSSNALYQIFSRDMDDAHIAALEAYNEIKAELYDRWFGQLPREDALTIAKVLAGVVPITISLLPDEPVTCEMFCIFWNKAHPSCPKLSVWEAWGQDPNEYMP